MRWKPGHRVKYGDARIKTGFLFLPRCDLFDNWRWLEYASFKQECIGFVLGCIPIWSLNYGWIDKGRSMDFYAWDWVEDAFWHFKTALVEAWCVVRCLWWAALSFVEWVCAVLKGET